MAGGYIAIGKIVGAHGIRGELKLLPYLDDVGSLLQLEAVNLEPPSEEPDSRKPVELARVHKRTILLKLEGLETRNQAEALVGREVHMPEELEPELPEGSFKLKTLLGMAVMSESGIRLGTLKDVDLHGERATLEVRLESGQHVLVPFVDEYVGPVDREGKTIILKPAFDRLLAPEEVGR